MAEQDMTLEEMFARLDEIADRLDANDITLDESVKVYTEGMKLLARCKESLDLTEKKLEKLNEDGELEEMA